MSSNIPQARTILRRLAGELQRGAVTKPVAAHQIRQCLSLLTRASPVRRAPTAKEKLTPQLRAQIIAYARAYPDAHLSDIAEWFKVNPGRVSEVLNGRR